MQVSVPVAQPIWSFPLVILSFILVKLSIKKWQVSRHLTPVHNIQVPRTDEAGIQEACLIDEGGTNATDAANDKCGGCKGTVESYTRIYKNGHANTLTSHTFTHEYTHPHFLPFLEIQLSLFFAPAPIVCWFRRSQGSKQKTPLSMRGRTPTLHATPTALLFPHVRSLISPHILIVIPSHPHPYSLTSLHCSFGCSLLHHNNALVIKFAKSRAYGCLQLGVLNCGQ
jgi:hypothetical protein